MPTSNRTTSATHLTNLSVDISEAQKNLAQLGKDFDNIAKRATQDATKMKDSLAGLGDGIGGAKGSDDDDTKGLSGVQSSIDSLVKSLSSSIKSTASTPDTNATINEARRGLRELLSDAQDLQEEIANESIKVKDAREAIQELTHEYKLLSTTLNLVEADYKAMGGKVADVRDFEKAKQQVQQFSESLTKTQNIKLPTEDISQKVQSLKSVLSGTINKIKETGTVTQEQAAILATVNSALTRYKTQLSELREAENKSKLALDDENKSTKDKSNSLKNLISLQDKYVRQLGSMYQLNTQNANYQNLIAETEGYTNALTNLINRAKESKEITPQMAQEYFDLQTNLLRVRQETNQLTPIIKEENAAYKQLDQSISKSIRELEKLARTTNGETKTSAQALSSSYKQLSQTLRTMPVDEARAQLEKLNARMAQLSENADVAGTRLQRFAQHLTNRAQWMASYAVLDTLTQSFMNIGNAIVEAEDAAIELQRVLGSGAPSLGNMKEELLDLAYEYGQTFENVQEVAVRFAQTGMDWSDTIAATRATMLGLNTAELEVDTATQGLIAVMAQFKIEADDLETVIDKINITADNFPVTSEKIVAALQRAGGTASAYNMTLEETIGLITALSEATGRSGESIGTALNSLISFTMKDSALSTFSGFLGFDVSQGYDVLQIWELLGEKIKGGDTAVAEFMASSAEFADLFNEQIAEAVGAQDELNLAVENSEDVYSSVGVYRKNYFIALLNNIATATEAMQGMANATGYSVQENETAMEALSKKINQLKAAAMELAVSLGESGVLDFAKTLVDGASAAIRFTDSIGGLNTVVGVLISILATANKVKIAQKFSALTTVINDYNTALMVGTTRTRAFQVAAEGVGISLKGVWTAFKTGNPVGATVTALTAVYAVGKGVYNAYKQAEEKAADLRQENIKLAQEAETTAKTIANAWEKYDLAKQTNDTVALKEAQNDLIEAFGYTEQDIDALIYKYGSLDAAIQKMTKDQYVLIQQNAVQGLKDAETEFKKNVPAAFEDVAYSVSDITSAEIAKILSKYDLGEIVGSSVSSAFKFNVPQADDVEGYTQRYSAAMDEISKAIGITNARSSALYDTMVRGNSVVESQSQQLENSRRIYELTSGTYEEYLEKLQREEALREVSVDTTQAQEDKLVELNTNLAALGEEYSALTEKVDKLQSAMSTLNSVVDEYNAGSLSIDTVQQLLELEPEYLEVLELKNGKLAVNKEKLEELQEATRNYLAQQAAVNAAEEYDNALKTLLANTTDEMTEAEVRAAVASVTLESSAAGVFAELASGKIDVENAKNKLAELGNQGLLTAAQLAVLEENTEATFTRLQNILSLIKNINFSTSSGGGSTSSGTTKTKEEKLLDSLNEKLEVYEHSIFLMEKSGESADKMVSVYRTMQQTIHALAEQYRKMGLSEDSEYIRKLQEMWWEYQDEITDLLDGMYEDSVKARENAISLLENQYGILQGSGDYGGMTANLEKQLKAQLEIQELAHNEAQRLRKLGADENDEAIQDCINAWWSAADDIDEIKEKMQESVLQPFDDFIDLADDFDLWDNLDISKFDYLQTKLSAINDLFKDGSMSVEKYNQSLQEIAKALYNAQMDDWQKQIDDIEEQRDKDIKAKEEEIDLWEEEKEKVEKYYEDLIDSLNEVQEDNDRINQQLDYYSERQKVITNLEQAQARSGVEYRQQEMEYQQELIDLDKDWNRTQQEWNIDDQINRLETLKETAVADIDLTIDKINKAITQITDTAEADTKRITDDMKIWAEQLAATINQGVGDGLVDTQKEVDQAWAAIIQLLGGEVAQAQNTVVEAAKESGTESKTAFDTSFVNPTKQATTDLSKYIQEVLTSGVTSAAKSAASSWNTNFTQQVQSELAKVQKQTKSSLDVVSTTASVATKIATGSSALATAVGTTVYVNNQVASMATAASKTSSILQNTKI